MDRTRGLLFSVGELLEGNVAEKRIDLSATLPERDSEVRLKRPVTGEIRFVPTDDGVLGMFNVEASLELPCSRDGEMYLETLRLSFTQEYRADPDDEAAPLFPDHTIDIVPTLWDEIIVNIPMKPLCPKHRE